MEDEMSEKSDFPASQSDGNVAHAKLLAIETLVVILLARLDKAEIGILDDIKREVAQMHDTPERKNSALIRAMDSEMLGLIERAINSASLTGSQLYRLRRRVRRIVQGWRG